MRTPKFPIDATRFYGGPKVGDLVYIILPDGPNRRYKVVGVPVREYCNECAEPSYWVGMVKWGRRFRSNFFGWREHNRWVYHSTIGHAASLFDELLENRRQAKIALLHRMRNRTESIMR